MEIHELFKSKIQKLELTEQKIYEMNKRYAIDYIDIMTEAIESVQELNDLERIKLNKDLSGNKDEYISTVNMTEDGVSIKIEFKRNTTVSKPHYDNDLVNEILDSMNTNIKVNIIDKRFMDINYTKEKNKVKNKVI